MIDPLRSGHRQATTVSTSSGITGSRRIWHLSH